MQVQSVAPQTLPPSPFPGQGPERTVHAATQNAEPVRAVETARPVTAPQKSTAAQAFSREAKADEPIRAEPESVVSARSATGNGPEAIDIEEPDPMVPPVPMRYLAELIKPRGDELRTPDEAETAQSQVEQVEAAEQSAEEGSSLDILR